jgi:hypothetical protein
MKAEELKNRVMELQDEERLVFVASLIKGLSDDDKKALRLVMMEV